MVGYPNDWQERRLEVLRRDNYRCQMCGLHSSEMPLDVDHATALSDGGNNSLANLQTLCVDCHYRKKHNDGVPKQAFERCIKMLNPDEFNSMQEVKEEVWHMITYSEPTFDRYWENYCLDDFVKDCFGWADEPYEPDERFVNPEIDENEVVRWYLLNGKQPSVDEVAAKFDISKSDARIAMQKC